MVPVNCAWLEVEVIDPESGEAARLFALVPQGKFQNIGKRQFATDEVYPMVVLEARSRSSHNHYFAALNEGYENLHESVSARWENVEHFRAWALIEAKFFHEEEHVFENPEEALEFGKRIGQFAKRHKTYVRIIRSGNRVLIRDAKSQSAANMAKAEFEESKRAVLDILATFTGASAAEIKKNAGRSA